MWFQSMLRWLLGVIDGWIYTACAWLYDLMMDIASARVFSNETIQDVSMRVYQLLGLVMLFRLIFAFLTYVINPEDMTDKNKGYTKIIKKIFTSLALVIITPWLFTQSRNLQIYIINDHLIEYFIFGTAGSSQARPGYDLMFTVTRVFYAPYACANANCSESKSKEESKTCLDVGWSNYLPEFEKKDGKFELKGDNTGKCGYGTNTKDYADNFYHLTHPSADGRYDFSRLKNVAQEYDSSKFKMDLQFPFIGSTLVGGFVFYVLLLMCMDIALRSVKLSFYEMIAPVPILSNLGFKDGKDSMLNKWFHEVLKTYADLFTRVAGLQIAIFAVEQITHNGNRGFADGNNGFVTLFLIIGALMFAKKLPDILKGMGINFEGGGSFNIKKKLNDEVAGSKLMKRAGAFGLGAVGGLASNANKVRANLWKAHRDNQALREEMRKQGYTKFDKANRDNFYSRNAKNQELGSVRHRRQYLTSQSAVDARKAAALSDHNRRMAELDRANNDNLAAPGLDDTRKNNINTHFEKLRQAEIERYKRESDKIGHFVENHNVRKEFKHDNAADNAYFFGSVGSMIAGTTSSAIRAATTKDGKLFAGAAEGVKGSNEARDLRDKQQGVDYGLGTQIGDKIRTFTGLDTEAKLRSNAMHDQINQMTAVLNTYQNQLNNYASELKPEVIEKIMRNPDNYKDFGSEAEKNYAATLKAYSKQQTEITKAQKKLEKLYESSKK